MGGLPRRQTVLSEAIAEDTTFVVDAGDLTWKSSTLADSRLGQQRIKAGIQFEAFSMGGIDAMVPGDADLALGVGWLSEAAEKYALPYVAANLRCKDWSVEPGRIVVRGGIRVAFIGVVGPSSFGVCGASSAVPAVAAAVRQLGDADLHIVLSHQPIENDLSLVQSIPEIDVVVNGHGRSQFNHPKALGSNAIHLASGTRGKQLGVASLTVLPGAVGFEIEGFQAADQARLDELKKRVLAAKQRVDSAPNERTRARGEQRLHRLTEESNEVETRLALETSKEDGIRNIVAHRLVDLSDEVEDDPVVRQMLDAAKEKIEAATTMKPPPKKASVQRSFVGDKPCRDCHEEEYGQWKSTAHAYAWSTLVREKRSQDLDCWSCHVTGAHHPDGPKAPNEVGVLENVGCESCHGPGQKHVLAPAKDNIVLSPSVSSCQNCHDGIKDEGRFDADTYMSKVTH